MRFSMGQLSIYTSAFHLRLSKPHQRSNNTSSIKNALMPFVYSLLVSLSLLPISAISQEATTSTQAQSESTIEGTVASVTRQTFVVRTADSQFYLFTFNRYTDKPQSIPV